MIIFHSKIQARSCINLSIQGSPVVDAAHHVLLTGSNGYLGKFLTLQLLRELDDSGGHLTAIVRAESDAAAMQRQRDSYGELAALMQPLEARLTVLAGDLMRPKLGLTDARYAELAGSVDTIVHNGALVNHALQYPALFEPTDSVSSVSCRSECC